MFERSALAGGEIQHLFERVDGEYGLGIERVSDNDDLHFGPSSLDLHVYPELCHYKGFQDEVNIADEETYPEVEWVEQDPLEIGPHEFRLARTDEYIDLPVDTMAFLHGRSSVGRLGLFVENAGFVDRGFEGTLTLELYNPTNNTIQIPAYTRLCQLVFFKHCRQASSDNAYNGKYDGQKKTTPSRGYKDSDSNGN